MTPAEAVDLVSKLGPLAKEYGIESLTLDGFTVKFRGGLMVVGKAEPAEGAKEPPKRFAGRTMEELAAGTAHLR